MILPSLLATAAYSILRSVLLHDRSLARMSRIAHHNAELQTNDITWASLGPCQMLMRHSTDY